MFNRVRFTTQWVSLFTTGISTLVSRVGVPTSSFRGRSMMVFISMTVFETRAISRTRATVLASTILPNRLLPPYPPLPLRQALQTLVAMVVPAETNVSVASREFLGTPKLNTFRVSFRGLGLLIFISAVQNVMTTRMT